MAERLSAKARECLEHAEDCARRARAEPNPAIQRDLIEMERSWLQLARSYEVFEWLQSSPTYQKKNHEQLSDRLEQLKRELAQQWSATDHRAN
jgi:hypothetical protein